MFRKITYPPAVDIAESVIAARSLMPNMMQYLPGTSPVMDSTAVKSLTDMSVINFFFEIKVAQNELKLISHTLSGVLMKNPRSKLTVEYEKTDQMITNFKDKVDGGSLNHSTF